MSAQTQLELFKARFNQVKIEATCLCGRKDGVRIRTADRYGINITPFFCTACGHVYSKYRLSETDLEHFYAESYRNLYTNGEGLKTFEATDSRIKASTRTILPAFQSLRDSRRNCVVVEWGCGAGWNLVPFRDSNVECYGFDFDREYIEYGRAQFGLDLRAIDAATDPAVTLDKKADFLVLNHVLEHVTDPFALLEQVAGILRPDGHIYVGLPFLERIPTWGFRNYFHIAHLHYFSIPYFVALARRNGWTGVAISKKHGYVVLRRGPVVETRPQYRAYNAYLIFKFAFIYLVLYRVWRSFANLVKKCPGAELCYVRVMKRFGRTV